MPIHIQISFFYHVSVSLVLVLILDLVFSHFFSLKLSLTQSMWIGSNPNCRLTYAFQGKKNIPLLAQSRRMSAYSMSGYVDSKDLPRKSIAKSGI